MTAILNIGKLSPTLFVAETITGKAGKLEITNNEGKKPLFAASKGYLDVQKNMQL